MEELKNATKLLWGWNGAYGKWTGDHLNNSIMAEIGADQQFGITVPVIVKKECNAAPLISPTDRPE